jgi:hypothetical protein
MVAVAVEVEVLLGVPDGVEVGVRVGEAVKVEVQEPVGLLVWVALGVEVGVHVGVAVGLLVGVPVEVLVGLGVKVVVAVGASTVIGREWPMPPPETAVTLWLPRVLSWTDTTATPLVFVRVEVEGLKAAVRSLVEKVTATPDVGMMFPLASSIWASALM